MRSYKFSCMWTNGKSWMDLRHTLGQMENGMHWDEMSDNPMLKEYKLICRRQFTGLKDKNGAEIYEGDIVYAEANNKTYIVSHGLYDNLEIDDKESPTCYGWFITYEKDPKYSDWLEGESLDGADKYLSVVGNIYENPDLIN